MKQCIRCTFCKLAKLYGQHRYIQTWRSNKQLKLSKGWNESTEKNNSWFYLPFRVVPFVIYFLRTIAGPSFQWLPNNEEPNYC